jgi:hypothetical protein
MASPFPGMNPYLEQPLLFHDFHQHFPGYAIPVLVGQLLPRYDVTTDTELYIHEPSADERRVRRADVSIVESQVTPSRSTAAQAPVLAEIALDIDEIRIPSIHILDAHGRRLVTAIELLSPVNKRDTAHRAVYLAKRRKYLESGANVVEIDLLRAGSRMPLRPVPTCDYLVAVYRASRLPSVELWPVSLRESLPVVPIPLAADDADATLDLKRVIDSIYDAMAYARRIYQGQPDPPLTALDAAWAEAVVREAASSSARD